MFSVIGFFYVKNRGKGGIARRFIPRRKAKDRDFLKIAREITENGDDVRNVVRRKNEAGKSASRAGRESGPRGSSR